jgi:hypothetical protein
MARNHQDIDRIVQSCLQAMRVDGESLDSVIARYPDLEASIRPPLEAALWLDRVKYSLDPTPEFVSGARQRLLAQIQRGNVTAAPSKQFSLRDFFADLARPQLALQFAFALLLFVFLVVGAGSIALASRNALPGDSLYNVKLIQEQVRLALAFTEIEDARLHAQFAQERLVEIQTLVLQERFEYLDQAVAGYEREVARAIELTRELAIEDASQAVALASQMDEMLSNQEMVLSTLSEQVPSQEQASIIVALDRAEAGLFELADIRDRLIGTGVPTATPTPTSTRTPTSEPPTLTPSPLATDLPVPAFGLTPTGTFEPALIQTSSPNATAVPTQVSEPVQPSAEAPKVTPEPTKEKAKPKPTNTHRPTARPTNPNRPTQNPDK